MVREGKIQGGNGATSKQDFRNGGGTERVRCSSEAQKEGTVHFIWQYNEKIINILHIKLKFTEVTWLVQDNTSNK